ncbi:hypothetical protein E4U41_004738, partial [Claviceps citrina]
NSTFREQFNVLSADYELTGFRFKLVNTTRTVNRRWADFKHETEMKKALRQGDYRDLNLYFVDNLLPYGDTSFGRTQYPRDAPPDSDFFFLDGPVIKSDTVPGGGSPPPANLGRTATHEVGHWFGVMHPFDGGCSEPNDGVDDTPAQASFSEGCPEKRNSCPSTPDLDLIHNFMDYSDDSCYESFTPGQILRMHSYWTMYRAGR